MEFADIVARRRSVRQFEPGVTLDDATLHTLFERVVQSPSSFNVQHWQFVVVREAARKAELRKLSYGQAQVEQCAAAVFVCGNLDAHADAARIYADADEEMRGKYVPMIEGVYRDQPVLQREEAIRSGALAAMTLMYAAQDLGWDSGPMIGFDAAKVSAYLALPVHVVPVMLVVLGRAAAPSGPRGYRRPLSEVVHLESFSGASPA
ncbi:MAG: nitroreductase family protein [Gammaproteobacteria bacterium]|nr:nitroreductase family protein [Gammaproteobacteria bacterium]